MLGQLGHERFERGFEGRVGGLEGLEFVERVLDLWGVSAVSAGGGVCMGRPYVGVLLAVVVGELLAVWDVLLHGRVDDEFFADGVAGEFPGELVLPAGFGVVVGGGDDVVVVLVEFLVVVFDGLGDGGHSDGGG